MSQFPQPVSSTEVKTFQPPLTPHDDDDSPSYCQWLIDLINTILECLRACLSGNQAAGLEDRVTPTGSSAPSFDKLLEERPLVRTWLQADSMVDISYRMYIGTCDHTPPMEEARPGSFKGQTEQGCHAIFTHIRAEYQRYQNQPNFKYYIAFTVTKRNHAQAPITETTFVSTYWKNFDPVQERKAAPSGTTPTTYHYPRSKLFTDFDALLKDRPKPQEWLTTDKQVDLHLFFKFTSDSTGTSRIDYNIPEADAEKCRCFYTSFYNAVTTKISEHPNVPYIATISISRDKLPRNSVIYTINPPQ